MCKASFDRAILTVNQFLKHDMIVEAKQTLTFAQHYSDNLPWNAIIIADIQKKINEREGRGIDNGC